MVFPRFVLCKVKITLLPATSDTIDLGRSISNMIIPTDCQEATKSTPGAVGLTEGRSYRSSITDCCLSVNDASTTRYGYR